MATFCKTYLDEAAAQQAIEELRAAGVPGHAIRMLAGHAPHDVRREPVGTFAGTIRPEAPVGTYGNVRRQRRQGQGSYAGDPDRMRRGCFADSESDVIVTYDRHVHKRVADRHELLGAMRDWHVVDDTAEHVIDELHAGRATVVVEVSEIAPDEVRQRLDGTRQEA